MVLARLKWSSSASCFPTRSCLGQAIPEDTSPITLLENFIYSDTTNFSSNSWNLFLYNTSVGTSTAQKIGIRHQQLYVADNGVFSAGITYGTILHKTKMHTSDHASEITIGSNFGSFSATTRAYLRCKGNGSAGVVMHVFGSSGDTRVTISTIASPTEQGTTQVSVTGLTSTPGDIFTIVAEGNVYTCYKNNVAISGATWTDSGNIIPQTNIYRTVGCGTGMQRDFAFDTRDDAADIDAWRGYDLS